jgi:hypothetical protein
VIGTREKGGHVDALDNHWGVNGHNDSKTV